MSEIELKRANVVKRVDSEDKAKHCLCSHTGDKMSDFS